MADLYDKLSSLPVLRRAWQLVRKDSSNDFLYDSLRYSDFAFSLDMHLQDLSASLQRGTFRPRPLRVIDVPKSSLSVRPGAVPEIEDRIVLYAVAILIAQRLDRALPQSVYSYRTRSIPTGELFHDHELLHFPFLKRRTIERRLSIMEPWYAQWPAFVKDVEFAYEAEGFRFLVVTDIAAYFEQIDLEILRFQVFQQLSRSPRLVNFLVGMLEYWAWPSAYGRFSPRGIPQGNDVSSFLGNFYLLPLDLAFKAFARRRAVHYFRYVDDVRVLAKDRETAVDALFLMNSELRKLRLTIQGAKTRIAEGAAAREFLFDSRLDEANRLVKVISNKRSLSTSERRRFATQLLMLCKRCKGRRDVIQERELRLFRRLMTGFTLLRHPAMLQPVLRQLQRNPDARLLASAATYFRHLEGSYRVLGRALNDLLQRPGLFPYQEAVFWTVLRAVREVPSDVLARAAKRLRSCRSAYVRQQSAALIGQQLLKEHQLRWMKSQFDREADPDVRRALAAGLTQLGAADLRSVVAELGNSYDRKLQRLGRMLVGLAANEQKGKEAVVSVFRNFDELVALDRLHELEVISRSKYPAVRERMKTALQRVGGKARRPHLRARLERLTQRLGGGVADALPE